MPHSKRDKVVHLTKVKKKGKDHKEDLKKQLEQYVEKFTRVFMFDFEKTKSDRIMNLRLRLKEVGKIFAGRNSIVAVAFKSVGSRTQSNYDHVLKHVSGHKGLLFTDMKCEDLIQLLDSELPEFREKLVGYAQLKHEDGDNEQESEMADDDDETTAAVGAKSGVVAQEGKKKEEEENMEVEPNAAAKTRGKKQRRNKNKKNKKQPEASGDAATKETELPSEVTKLRPNNDDKSKKLATATGGGANKKSACARKVCFRKL